MVKVAGVSTSNIKAEELDGPLAWACECGGGSIPTVGAAAAESIISSRMTGVSLPNETDECIFGFPQSPCGTITL